MVTNNPESERSPADTVSARADLTISESQPEVAITPEQPALAQDSFAFEPGYEQVIWPMQRLMDSELPVDRKAAADTILAGIARTSDIHNERYIELVPECVEKGVIKVSDDLLESILDAGAVGGVLSEAAAMRTLAKIAPEDNRTLALIQRALETSYDPVKRSATLVALQDIPAAVLEARPDLVKLADAERKAIETKFGNR